MNSVIIIGRLTKDPEGRTTQSGISAATFTVAVDRPFKAKDGKREADFLNVVAWRQSAEFVTKYAHKGDRIAVNGSIQTRNFTAQDGGKRYVTEIIADRVELLSAPHKTEDGLIEAPDEKLPWEE